MTIRDLVGWMSGMRVTIDDAPPKVEAPRAPSAITVSDKREDRPKFRRTYKAALPAGRTIEVTAHSGYGGRYYGGELTQPSGRWVLFDPERVADKILDPELVPLIMSLSREMLQMDDEFMASKPREFTDENGQRWVRA